MSSKIISGTKEICHILGIEESVLKVIEKRFGYLLELRYNRVNGVDIPIVNRQKLINFKNKNLPPFLETYKAEETKKTLEKLNSDDEGKKFLDLANNFFLEQKKLCTEFLEPVEKKPFKFDEWQLNAIDLLAQDYNVIVNAATTSGKTIVAEEFINRNLSKKGFKLVYTTPIKALSNDKFREFKVKFGVENVGLQTGDFKINVDAPVVVATLESYRNTLVGLEDALHPAIVVFDEYQYLGDLERGYSWEEAVILSSDETQMLFLSASVPNIEEFKNWINNIKQRECKIINNIVRPVPLIDVVFSNKHLVFSEELKKFYKENSTKFEKYFHFFKLDTGLNEVLLNILKFGIYPVIVYLGSRRDVIDSFYAAINSKLFPKLNQEERAAINDVIEANTLNFEYLPDILKTSIIQYGVAYHSAALNPLAKLIIEILLKQGLIKICFGTMSLSLGINFSVKSTLIADTKRPQAGGVWKEYSDSEILQLSGRAGRRGIDRYGFVIRRWFNPEEQKPLEPESVASTFNININTFLNLFDRYHDEVKIIDLNSKSFRNFAENRSTSLDLTSCRVINERNERKHKVVNVSESLNKIPEVKQDVKRISVANIYKFLVAKRIPIVDIHNNRIDIRKLNSKKRYRIAREKGRVIIFRRVEEFDEYLGRKDSIESSSGNSDFCRKCAEKRFCTQSVVLEPLKIADHLYSIGAIHDKNLTEYGQILAQFPQTGSMVMAYAIYNLLEKNQTYNTEKVYKTIKSLAAFCLNSYKSNTPEAHLNHRFYNMARFFYPRELFNDLWDNEYSRVQRTRLFLFREFNPLGEEFISSWLRAEENSWSDLVNHFSQEYRYIEEGDLVQLILKYADILRSCIRIKNPAIQDISRMIFTNIIKGPINHLVQRI